MTRQPTQRRRPGRASLPDPGRRVSVVKRAGRIGGIRTRSRPEMIRGGFAFLVRLRLLVLLEPEVDVCLAATEQVADLEQTTLGLADGHVVNQDPRLRNVRLHVHEDERLVPFAEGSNGSF